jgi:hypothetical protein
VRGVGCPLLEESAVQGTRVHTTRSEFAVARLHCTLEGLTTRVLLVMRSPRHLCAVLQWRGRSCQWLDRQTTITRPAFLRANRSTSISTEASLARIKEAHFSAVTALGTRDRQCRMTRGAPRSAASRTQPLMPFPPGPLEETMFEFPKMECMKRP